MGDSYVSRFGQEASERPLTIYTSLNGSIKYLIIYIFVYIFIYFYIYFNYIFYKNGRSLQFINKISQKTRF